MTQRVSSRRRFLQGVGGIALAAPFLSSLGRRVAFADPVAAQQRLLVMFTHHGCLANRWFPTRSHGALTAADYQATTLAPLAPFADKLLMPRGIRAMNEWSFEQTRGQETYYHNQVVASYFTCCPVDGWSGMSATPESIGLRPDVPARRFEARPYGGRSLDHVCAEQLSPSGLPLYLGVGRSDSSEAANFSYKTAGSETARAELFPPTTSFTTVFSQLLGGLNLRATENVLHREAVLDLVRDDLKRLQANKMSSSDKRLLQAWEGLLDSSASAAAGECAIAALDGLGTTTEALQAIDKSNDLQAHTPAMLDLAVLSALCSTNPVIFMKFPFGGDFSFLPGLDVTDADQLAHRVGIGLGGTCFTDVNLRLRAIDEWYAQQFAALVGKLDSITEGDGTLLDNTATVWFQEVSAAGAMNLNNIPILQAGGCGGYFKTGVAVNVDDGADDLPNGDSESACAAGPVETDYEILRAAATPPEFANAPINKYFCNLMNAIGVRADETGFANPQGDAPVSRFGYYDDTTAFATFLKPDPLPPTINDPGEFTELRASA